MTQTQDPAARDDFTGPQGEAELNLAACDREPIRAPGAIQPHGVLLVLHARDLVIVQASANTLQLIGQDTQSLLGAPVSTFLGTAQAAAISRQVDRLKARGEERGDMPLRFTLAVNGSGRLFNARVFRDALAGVVLLELEPASTHDALSLYGFHTLVRQTLERIRNATTVDLLAQAIAEQMRMLTGYDRVWVYRFHPDWHGEIIAESCRAGTESWLGLHYPASDIPGQARALFLEHPLRVIADVDYEPVPLVPAMNPVSALPLDLGGAVLRAVSPVHLQYMRNMGVRASLVISIVRDGVLWGLLSGHHYATPKTLPYELHTVCEFLGQAFALQLTGTEGAEDRDRMLRTRSVEGRLVELLAQRTAAEALTASDVTMLELIPSDGAAIVGANGVARVGSLPDDAFLGDLVDWLERSAPADGPSARSFDALAGVFAPAQACTPTCSGLLAVRVSSAGVDEGSACCWLLWFRGERAQSLRWAGNPEDKPVRRDTDGSVRLSPRGSFAVWEQEVRGTSRAWTTADRESAEALSRVVHLAPEGLWVGPATEARRLKDVVDDLRSRMTAAASNVPSDVQFGFDVLSLRVDALIAMLSEPPGVID